MTLARLFWRSACVSRNTCTHSHSHWFQPPTCTFQTRWHANEWCIFKAMPDVIFRHQLHWTLIRDKRSVYVNGLAALTAQYRPLYDGHTLWWWPQLSYGWAQGSLSLTGAFCQWFAEQSSRPSDKTSPVILSRENKPFCVWNWRRTSSAQKKKTSLHGVWNVGAARVWRNRVGLSWPILC